jgi:hypothetical protein
MVFDRLVMGSPLDPSVNARNAGRKSVLDFVAGNAKSLEGRLGHGDRARMDQFLTSVRDLETRIGMMTPPPECQVITRPTFSASTTSVPTDYNRDTHANVMIDLIVMALACDRARVVSFMLDDARSDFPYNFVPKRHFTSTGSTPVAGNVTASPIVAANTDTDPDPWSTIDWWFASKASALCQKLAALPDGGGATLLDNTVVWFGSGQQGETMPADLPVLFVGGGGGSLRTNRCVSFAPHQRLSNVYLTFLRNVFGVMDEASFGDSTGIVPELLA